MKKIPSLFVRNFREQGGDGLVRPEVTRGCEWALSPFDFQPLMHSWVPTRKWDGTCCMWDGEVFWKRYDAKRDHRKKTAAKWTAPLGFVPAQEPDEETGHWPGWIKVDSEKPEDRWHHEAFLRFMETPMKRGTYELCGPKLQGNPEGLDRHILILHGEGILYDFPKEPSFDSIREFLSGKDIEGVVWHARDGRMCKIKKKDFGLSRKPTGNLLKV